MARFIQGSRCPPSTLAPAKRFPLTYLATLFYTRDMAAKVPLSQHCFTVVIDLCMCCVNLLRTKTAAVEDIAIRRNYTVC